MNFTIENEELIKYEETENDTVVRIPEGVKVIKTEAFEFALHYAKEIYFPSTLEKIEDYAMDGAIWVEHIDLPENLKELGMGTFFLWCRLKDIKLPEGMTKIPVEMFGMCDSLETVELPKTVTEIDDSAFYRSQGISKIDFTNIKRVGVYAFYDCPKLKEVIFSDKLEKIEFGAFETQKIGFVVEDNFVGNIKCFYGEDEDIDSVSKFTV